MQLSGILRQQHHEDDGVAMLIIHGPYAYWENNESVEKELHGYGEHWSIVVCEGWELGAC